MIFYYENCSITKRKYFQNKCKTNRGLFWLIYQSMIATVHEIFDDSILTTYILNVLFGLLINDKYIIYKANM